MQAIFNLFPFSPPPTNLAQQKKNLWSLFILFFSTSITDFNKVKQDYIISNFVCQVYDLSWKCVRSCQSLWKWKVQPDNILLGSFSFSFFFLIHWNALKIILLFHRHLWWSKSTEFCQVHMKGKFTEVNTSNPCKWSWWRNWQDLLRAASWLLL